MSRSIDNRIVHMTFDNKNFEKNVSDTLVTINKLDKSLGQLGSGSGVSGVSEAASKIDLSPMEKAADGVKVKFDVMSMAAMSAIDKIVGRAVASGARILKSLTIDPIMLGMDEFDLKQNNIQTIMAGTGEDVYAVGQALDELNHYADKTKYVFSDMTSNIGKFTNAGVGLDKSVGAIQGISNAAALAGANANEASRSMYNFSQALSTGTVQVIDWRSIELANMATKEFREEIINSAVAMGTLSANADGTFNILTTNNKGSLAEMTLDWQNFRNTLSYNWFTDDVLIDVLNRYSDETTDLGARAFEAAQAIKTLSEFMGVLEETSQSGWAKTWELVLGNYHESVDLFTGLNNVIGGWLEGAAEQRNKQLTHAMERPLIQFKNTLENSGLADGVMDKFMDRMTEFGTKAGMTGAQYNSIAEEFIATGNLTAKEAKRQLDLMLSEQITALKFQRGESKAVQDLSIKDLETYDALVLDIIRGNWGNQPERQKALENAHYDFTVVQDLVNKKMAEGKVSIEEWAAGVDAATNEQLKNAGASDTQVKALRQLTGDTSELNKLIDEISSGDWSNWADYLDIITEAGLDASIAQEMMNNQLYLSEMSAEEYAATLDSLSDSQLVQMGWSMEQINVIRDLIEESEDLDAAFGQLINRMDKAGGRELFHEGIYSGLEAIQTLVAAVGRGIEKAFPKGTGEGIYNLMEAFNKFMKALVPSTKTLERVERAVGNVATAFGFLNEIGKMTRSVINGVAQPIIAVIKNVIQIFLELIGTGSDTFSGLLGGFRDFVSSPFIAQVEKISAKATEAVNKFFGSTEEVVEGIVGALARGADGIKEFFSSIKIPIDDTIDWFTNLYDNVAEVVTRIGDKLKELRKIFSFGKEEETEIEISDTASSTGGGGGRPPKGVLNAPVGITEEIAGMTIALNDLSEAQEPVFNAWTIIGAAVEKVGEAFRWAGNAIKGAWQSVKDFFAPLWDSLSEFFRSKEWRNLITGVGTLSISSFIRDLGGFFKSLGEYTKKLPNLSLDLDKFLAGLSGSLNKFSKGVNKNATAKVIKSVAMSILAMAAAMLILASIDKTELETAMEAMTTMMGMITLILIIVGFITSGETEISRVLGKGGGLMTSKSERTGAESLLGIAGIVVAIGAAVLLMSGAVKNIASLEKDELDRATAAIGWLTAFVVAAMAGLEAIQFISDKLRSPTAILNQPLIGGELSGVGEEVKKAKKQTTAMMDLIGIAASIYILAKAVGEIGEIPEDKLWGAVGAIAILGGVITGMYAVMKLADIKGGGGSRGKGMKDMAAALLMMVAPVYILGRMDTATLEQGIVAVSLLMIVMASLQALMNLTSKTKSSDMNFKDGLFSSTGSSGSDGIIKLAVALNLLVIPIAILGSMSLPTLAKGLGAMAIGLGVLVGVAVLLDKFGGSGLDKLANFFLKIAASAAIVVGAIALIIASLTLFAKGLSGLVYAMLAAGAAAPLIVAGFEAVGKGIGLMIPAIVAGIIVGLGLIINAISDFGVMFAKAIVNFVIGLIHEFAYAFDGIMEALLMVMDTLVTYVPDLVDKFLTLIYEILNQLTVHAPEIISKVMEFISDILSEVIVTIESMDPTTMKDAVKALFGIALLMKVLSMLKVDFKQAMKGLGQLALFSAVLGLAIWGMGALLGDTKVKEFITSGGDILGALSVAVMKAVPLLAAATILVYALKGLTDPVVLKGVLIGIGAVALVIAGLTVIIAALGGLSKIKGFNKLINDGGEVFKKLATILGSVIAEFGAALTSTLPKIGENLASFGESLGKFGKSTSDITSDSMSGVTTVVDMIMALTKATLVDSFVGLFTDGKSSMVRAGEELIKFGEAMVKFSDTISGIDIESVEAAVAVGDMLVAIQDAMPTSGGLKGLVEGLIFGNQDTLGDLSDGLVGFGFALMAFQNATEKVDPDKVSRAASAAKMVAGLSETLPNDGTGVISSWFGSAMSWSQFGEGLADFGKAMTHFQVNTDNLDKRRINVATSAGKMIADLAKELPNDGTSVIESWFGSTMTWSEFGRGLGTFGKAMTVFQTNTDNLDKGRIEVATTAGTMIADLAKKLPNDGTSKIESWFGSTMTWSEFGRGLANFGAAMTYFQVNTDNLDEGRIEVATTAGTLIADLAKKLPSGTGKISSWFGSTMSWDDISDGLAGFGSAVSDFHTNAGSITKGTANKAEYAVGIVLSLYDKLTGFDDGTTVMDTLAQMFGADTGTSWYDIGDGLTTFGGAVSRFMGSLDNYTEEDVDTVSSIVDVVKAIVDIVNYIDGEASLDTGVLADFGEDMIDFSESLVSFAGNMDGIDLTNVDTFVDAVDKIKPVLAEVKSLYDNGVYNESGGWGAVGPLEGAMLDIVSAYKVIGEANDVPEVDLSGLTDTFDKAALIPPLYEQLVNDMQDNADSLEVTMQGIDDIIPRLILQSTKLVNVIANTLTNEDNREKVTTAGETMVDTLIAAFVDKKATIKKDVSDTVVKPVVDAIAATDHDTKFKDAGKNIVTTITAGFAANTSKFEDGVKDMMAKGIEMMDGRLYIEEIVANMNQVVKGMATTLTSKDNRSTIEGAADELGGDIDDGFRGKYSDIYKSGAHLVSGLIAGLESKRPALKTKSTSLANTVTNTLNKEFVVKSPSRVTTRTGEFVVQGLVNAIVSGQDEARKSALGLVESITTPMNRLNSNEAHDLMAQFMGALQASMDDEVSEIKPRIRPLVDLEEFDASMGYMARSISGTTAVTANRTAGRFQRTKADQQSHQDTINNQHSTTSNAYDVKNEFYISGTNAREIAEEVSVILGEQTKREQTVWR